MLIALRHHRLDGGDGAGQYGDILKTTASVIVSSKTDDDITRSAKLAVVPYGDGSMAIRRDSAKPTTAEVQVHAFDGQTNSYPAQVRDGWLPLELHEHAKSGSPVEWMEVSF